MIVFRVFTIYFLFILNSTVSYGTSNELTKLAPWLRPAPSNSSLEKCISEKENALSKDPFNVHSRIELSACYRLAADFSSAGKHLTIAQNLYNDHIKVLEEKAMLALQTKNYPLCKKTLDHILAKNPEAYTYLLPRSFCAKKTHDYQVALHDLDVLSQKDPSEVIFQTETADVLALMGNEDKARAYLATASKLDSDDPNLWEKIGDIDARKKSFNNAEIAYKKALELEPDNIEYKKKLFFVYLSLQKYTEAEPLGYEIIKKEPSNETILKSFVYVLKKSEQFQKLSNLLTKFSELNPNLTWPYLEDAKLSIKILNYEKAQTSLQQAVKLGEKNQDVFLSLAFVYDVQGNSAEAAGTLLEAKKHFPNDPKIQFNLALSYEKSGKVSEAIEAYRAVGSSDALLKAKSLVNLGLLLESTDRLEDSLATFQEIRLSDTKVSVLVSNKIKTLKTKVKSRSLASERKKAD